MQSRIQSATVLEYPTGQLLQIRDDAQIQCIHGSDSREFLLALAGLFGKLPNTFPGEMQYHVEASVIWKNDTACHLDACFHREESAVWVRGVEAGRRGISASASQAVRAIHKQRFRNHSDGTHLFHRSPAVRAPVPLGESDETLRSLSAFLRQTQRNSMAGDTRPIFLFDLLERLDESVDYGGLLSALASTGRQVFIALPQYYPVRRLTLPPDLKTTSSEGQVNIPCISIITPTPGV